MVNEDYTYFELTARDEYLLNMKIVGVFWFINVFFNIWFYLAVELVFILIISQCIGTILIIYSWHGVSEKNRKIKELIINEDGIMLYSWFDKNYYTLKWYQIKSVHVQNRSTSDYGWVLTIHTHNDEMCFMFSPYYWYAKPKKCIKVLENCVDVKAKLKIGK